MKLILILSMSLSAISFADSKILMPSKEKGREQLPYASADGKHLSLDDYLAYLKKESKLKYVLAPIPDG
ncbi:MAG: hypothetical protein AB8F34_09345 [Akkermansiaceae bacterium]